MIKEPISNILGLKALAWSYTKGMFVSPAQPDCVWGQGGLQSSECAYGHKHEVPFKDCTCGLYATYMARTALEYTVTSPISPIFLIEASGRTQCHQLGWRSKEATIQMVAPSKDDPFSKAAAVQAANYFSVTLTDLTTMLMVMDIFNTTKFPEFYTSQMEFSPEELSKIYGSLKGNL